MSKKYQKEKKRKQAYVVGGVMLAAALTSFIFAALFMKQNVEAGVMLVDFRTALLAAFTVVCLFIVGVTVSFVEINKAKK
jgi:hypothetical protein